MSTETEQAWDEYLHSQKMADESGLRSACHLDDSTFQVERSWRRFVETKAHFRWLCSCVWVAVFAMAYLMHHFPTMPTILTGLYVMSHLLILQVTLLRIARYWPRLEIHDDRFSETNRVKCLFRGKEVPAGPKSITALMSEQARANDREAILINTAMDRFWKRGYEGDLALLIPVGAALIYAFTSLLSHL